MLVMAAYFVPVNFLSAMTLALIAPLLLSIGSTVRWERSPPREASAPPRAPCS
jgi:hypothetical protein